MMKTMDRLVNREQDRGLRDPPKRLDLGRTEELNVPKELNDLMMPLRRPIVDWTMLKVLEPGEETSGARERQVLTLDRR